MGIDPGGKNRFAASTLYYNGRLPASLIASKVHSGVDDVLADVVGQTGEWSELTAVAIAAPLTWSGVPSGWRNCDVVARRLLPDWVPKSWWRPPNVLSGAVAVQGPALAWALAREIKGGVLPQHKTFETHPRASLALVACDLRAAILGYQRREATAAEQRKHVARIVEHFVDAGIVRIETKPPVTGDELQGLICALTALGACAPETGLVVHELEGGDIRPVGKRSLALLKALP